MLLMLPLREQGFMTCLAKPMEPGSQKEAGFSQLFICVLKDPSLRSVKYIAPSRLSFSRLVATKNRLLVETRPLW